MQIYLAGENGKMKILSAMRGGYIEVDAYIHGGRDLGEPLSDVAKHLVEDKVGSYP